MKTQNLTILRISTRILPDIGGVAKQVYQLSKYFSENNIKVFNIACKIKNNVHFKKKKINENFEINFLPFPAPHPNTGVSKLALFFIIYFLFGFIKSVKIIRKYKPHLIHAHSPAPSGFVAYFASKIFRIPYIYSLHGMDYPIPFILNLDIDYVINHSKITTVVSRKIESFIKKRVAIKEIIWLPNAIDLSNYYHVKSENEKYHLINKLNLQNFLEKDDFIITYIGYMIFPQKVKGMIDFLKAFSNFLKRKEHFKKIKLVFVGDGKYLPMLESEVKSLNIEENVIILGKRNDVKDILAISNLLSLTSYIEGFPNSILEAMASKVPCLGSDTGEIKFLIGETGYIVKPGDIDNIEKKIDIFYTLTESEQIRLMEAAFIRVKKLFAIEKIGKRYVDIYYG